jgi:hypothetical protein
MCEEAEVIAQGKEGVFMYFYPALTIQIGKYPPVFPQQTVNITDKVVCVAVKPVVIIVPALVGTEFLIGTSMD